MQTIFEAAREGNTDSLKSLITQDKKLLDSSDERGFTPLILAVYNHQEEASKVLLDAGASVDARDAAGNTALMGAAVKRDLTHIQLLLAHGADVNARSNSQATALCFACAYATPDVVKVLLRAGADPQLKDADGLNAMGHARKMGNRPVMDFLMTL